MDQHPTLTFLGAAGTVTGSKFLIASRDTRILVDAGMFQGLRALRRRNWEPFPMPASDVHAVALTHAHLDHCGYLPAMVNQGFHGPVLATAATAELAALVLRDSAKLQEEDAKYAASRGFSKHAHPEPLYDAHDVEQVLPLFRPVDFYQRTTAAEGIEVVLQPAGHILGSSSILGEVAGTRVVFSGDLGRPNHPLLKAPPAPPACDAIVIESTYGNRVHEAEGLGKLASIIGRTVERGGSVVIPAFAVDRTEVVLMALKRLTQDGRIPRVPVFVDSPMALGALRIYQRRLEAGDPELRTDLGPEALVFDPGDLHEAHTAATPPAASAARPQELRRSRGVPGPGHPRARPRRRRDPAEDARPVRARPGRGRADRRLLGPRRRRRAPCLAVCRSGASRGGLRRARRAARLTSPGYPGPGAARPACRGAEGRREGPTGRTVTAGDLAESTGRASSRSDSCHPRSPSARSPSAFGARHHKRV